MCLTTLWPGSTRLSGNEHCTSNVSCQLSSAEGNDKASHWLNGMSLLRLAWKDGDGLAAECRRVKI